MTPARVIIVDDHALVRAGLRTALNAAGFEIAGEAADGPEALAMANEADVFVIDIALPGFDGIELTRRLKQANPKARVAIVTMHEVDRDVSAAIAAGADAYCVKNSDTKTILDAVRAVAAGAAYFDPQIAHVMRKSVADTPLTDREVQILRLVADGTNNLDIADRLNISLGTVKGHIRDILDKLQAGDRTQAAVIAL
ncbi:MAG TPA: response regulator transcription factor, partial [Candidatus Baltobacteraceae bacterium]|nr:response regulator transcription factor [Candidatus Baltobacteraceae bacterium]